MNCTTATLCCLIAIGIPASAGVEEFSNWTEIADPPGTTMDGVFDSATQVTLTSIGAVSSGADVGYTTINGLDVASSTQGYYFDTGSDFEIAVDFSISSTSSTGLAGIGFGIGEDIEGMDSAGVGLGILSGVPVAFSTAARVGDSNQPLATIPATATASGRLFVDYLSLSKVIIVGVSATPGASVPDATETISGVATQWDNQPLIASVFLRSEGLTGGSIDAVFSNFEVLSGTATRIPEPATALLAAAALLSARRR